MSHSVPISALLAQLEPAKGKGPVNQPSLLGFFGILFCIILDAMSVRQATVITQSKEIEANATIQDQLNKSNSKISFCILPAGAKTATINIVQQVNQERAAQREDIQNQLITARQNAQVMMTQTSTNVNILQQDASEDSGWLQTINTIFQVIDEMSPGA